MDELQALHALADEVQLRDNHLGLLLHRIIEQLAPQTSTTPADSTKDKGANK